MGVAGYIKNLQNGRFGDQRRGQKVPYANATATMQIPGAAVLSIPLHCAFAHTIHIPGTLPETDTA
jgi:hypothetical protein